MKPLYSNGIELSVDADALGELEDSSAYLEDEAALRAKMEAQGYLFFRGLIDTAVILEAREEILMKFAIIGEIDPEFPINDAIYGGGQAIHQVNLRAFSRSVRDGIAYRRVVLDESLLKLHEKLLGGKVRAFDFRWPRFARPGEGCGVHCDGPYLTRGTDRIYSSWIPLGDVAREEGALMILERGPQHHPLLKHYLAKDADRDGLQWLGNPRELRQRFDTRWLTTDFRAGDVLCFAMDTVHAALDNKSPIGRCRLSSDSRYQLASEPLDERWNGPDPPAHGRDKVFFPGLGSWNNKDFQDEWKTVDRQGRLVIDR